MILIAQNKKAVYNYFIESRFEAGISLMGSEVKSLRVNGASLEGAYAAVQREEVFLYNSYIKEYKNSQNFGHEPKRKRKLLLKKKEIKTLIGKLKKKGYSLLALSLYFNDKNLAKIELALGKGKKLFDKRHVKKEREWNIQKGRLLRKKY